MEYSIAADSDEPDIRRLLREHSMDGWVRLALEREPDAYAGGFGLPESHQFLIVRSRDDGQAVAICERRVHAAYVDGSEIRLPYLAALRVVPEHRHRIRLLKAGFDAVHQLMQEHEDAPYALTSIGADNLVARRLLVRGIAGLPTYAPLGALLTLALATPRVADRRPVDRAGPGDLEEIADLLQSTYRELQCAPVWTRERLRRLDQGGALPIDRFVVARGPSGLRGCIAVWGQENAKQTRVVDYRPPLAQLRPLYNVLAPWIGGIRLPRPGTLLNQAFLSHFALASEDDAVTAAKLVGDALALAGDLGYSVGLFGIAERRPLATEIRRLWRVQEYRSELFTVHWSGVDGPAERERMLHPEIALL